MAQPQSGQTSVCAPASRIRRFEALQAGLPRRWIAWLHLFLKNHKAGLKAISRVITVANITKRGGHYRPINVGDGERLISVAGGGALSIYGLKRGGFSGLMMTIAGGVLIYRGA